ncbi:MAG: hypothetical protein LBC03_01185 [Nitrososphaerota archaeon]|jgi:hypothetical protein|nr:hypothetical protein [Nitrososphaerota archaeon]
MSIEKKLNISDVKNVTIRKKAVQEILNQIELITEEDFAEIVERATYTGQFNASLVKQYDSLKNLVVSKKLEVIAKLEKVKPGVIGFPIGIPAPDIMHLRFDNQVFAVNSIQMRLLEKEIGVKLQAANTIRA